LPAYFARIAGGGGPHAVVSDATQADAFLFVGNKEVSLVGFSPNLRLHPLVRREPRRCFAWSFNDVPFPLLPGLYASLPRPLASARTTAYGYLAVPNPAVGEMAAEKGRTTNLLFSFVGAMDNKLRRRLVALGEPGRSEIVDTSHRPTWFLERGADRGYAELLSRSAFVLCPAGHGTATYRIFEAMQLGRVPVLLSDDWVPPEGPDWSSFSLRVAERDATRVPRLLTSRAGDARAMGERARAAWEEWFAPEVQLRRVGDALERIAGRVAPWDLGVSLWRLRAAHWRAERYGANLRNKVTTAIDYARATLAPSQ
jgi:hypothetical protein